MRGCGGKWLTGILIGAAIFIGVRLILLNAVVHTMTHVNNVAQQGFNDMAAKIQADSVHRAAQAEHDRQAKLERDAAALRAKDATVQEKSAAAKAQELAFARFYSAPKECDHPPDWNAQVKCGNKFMRAKRAFETQYSNAASP